MSLTVIDVDGVEYDSYASLTEAATQLAVDPRLGPTWPPLMTPPPADAVRTASIALVAATRALDRLSWAGSPVTEAQRPRAWYRRGVRYPDGAPVPVDLLPARVEEACILIAAGAVAEAGTIAPIEPEPLGPSPTKRIQADTVQIEYFSPAAQAGLSDTTAWRLVVPFLAQGAVVATPIPDVGTETSFPTPGYPRPEWYP